MKRRILVLLKTLGVGGAETLVLGSTRHWDRTKFDYRLGWLGGANDLEREFTAAGARPIRFSPLGSGNDPFSAAALARYFRRERIDLVHAHLPVPALAAGIAARLADTKVVSTSHCEPAGMRPFTAFIARSAWPFAEAVIAVGENVARTVTGARKAIVIENGIELPPAGTKPADLPGVPPDAPVVLVTGSLAEVKRPLETLRVFEQASAGTQAHLAFAGDGPLRGRLEAARLVSPAKDRIHLLGQRRDIQELVKRASVICLLSHNEGLPMSLLEGAAGGLPVLGPASSSAAGTLIENGVTGFAAESDGDAARRLRDLLGNPGLRERLGAAARKRVVERFSLEANVRRTETLYREVLG